MKIILVFCLLLSALSINAEGLTIVVSNSSNSQRQELVEIELSMLKQNGQIVNTDEIVITNAAKTTIPHQITHDGKLVFEAIIQPHNTAKFKITKGVSSLKTDTFAVGALYTIRLDDIAWENDKCAWRVYGPALQRTGERAFGIDIWTKNISTPVVAERYRLNNYHKDNGNGLDCYNVGPSLGCGAPALMQSDTLVLPYCWENYKILDNGPLRFSLQLDYPVVQIGKDKVKEHRIITLDKGSRFNKMVVWYEGLKSKTKLASGVVIHKSSCKDYMLGKDYVSYADPTDNIKKNNFQIYVACLYPYESVSTRLILKEDIKDVAGHAIGVMDYLPGTKFTYYFGAAWSKYDVPTHAVWQSYIQQTLNDLKNPLQIKLEN